MNHIRIYNEQYRHEPVLLQETIDALKIKHDGIYLDGTFGRGGHAKKILELLSNKGKLIALDWDIDGINYGKTLYHNDSRVFFFMNLS